MAYSRCLIMRNKPRIRFKGFTEDWEQRKLESLGKIITGNTPSTLKKEYWSTNSEGVVWITPTDINSVKTDWSERLLTEEGASQARIVPANSILVTCIASIGKNTINTVEAAFNQQINALVPHLANSYFIFTMLNNMESAFKRVAGTSATSIINKKEFGQLSALLPRVEEQNKIGEIFELIDKSITLHQRKLEKLKLAKKALLQKLFPKNGSQFPEIRFKGFTDAWEQRKLSDISTKVTTKNVDVHYTETLTNSAEQGIISQVDFFDKEISNKDNINGYYIVDNNDFIYNPRISILAPVGPINRNKLNRTGIMSPLYTVFRSSNIDLGFLEWYFQSSHWHRYMKLNGDSGARADRIAIKDSTFFEMPIKIPVDIKEQVLIGETLEKFNQYITLHQCKLDKLQDVKKGLIQKMFV